MPPSPDVRIFEDWWLNEPKSPMQPAPVSLPPLPVRVRAVLDDREAVPPRDLHDPVHVGHLVTEVHRHDRLASRS